MEPSWGSGAKNGGSWVKIVGLGDKIWVSEIKIGVNYGVKSWVSAAKFSGSRDKIRAFWD